MERVIGIDHLGGWSRDDSMKAERLLHRRAAEAALRARRPPAPLHPCAAGRGQCLLRRLSAAVGRRRPPVHRRLPADTMRRGCQAPRPDPAPAGTS